MAVLVCPNCKTPWPAVELVEQKQTYSFTRCPNEECDGEHTKPSGFGNPVPRAAAIHAAKLARYREVCEARDAEAIEAARRALDADEMPEWLSA